MTETGAPSYENLEIAYTLDGGRGALARRAFQPGGGAPESAVRQAAHGTAFSAAALRIQYPHPEGREGYVRATLRLSYDAPPPKPQSESWTDRFRSGFRWVTGGGDGRSADTSARSDDELWVLDFPKQQLDLALLDLAHTGFFDDQQHRQGGVYLKVRIDRGETAKTWTPEPRLDDLITRVYREGWLVGFMPPKDIQEAPIRQVEWTEPGGR